MMLRGGGKEGKSSTFLCIVINSSLFIAASTLASFRHYVHVTI